VDMDEVVSEARAGPRIRASCSWTRLTNRGSDASAGPDVSREGVQRDLLPVVEAAT